MTTLTAVPQNAGTLRSLKPRTHQQQCRRNVRLCCQNGNNVERVYLEFRPFDKVCFDFVERTKFRSTLLPKPATLLPTTTPQEMR